MAEMDCAAVAEAGGVESLPTSGYLLFFFGSVFRTWDQGQVIYVPAGAARRSRQPPESHPEVDEEPMGPIEEMALPARQISTPPSTNPDLIGHNFGAEIKRQSDEFRVDTSSGRAIPIGDPFPLWDDEFSEAVRDGWGFCQVGGYARTVQHRPLELEAARSALGTGPNDASERVLSESEHWRLLLQTVWDEGDLVLYWMVHDTDLAAGRFDRVWFGMQR